jgi:putative tryptophan/tyrosine transport system substrate-binding protein
MQFDQLKRRSFIMLVGGAAAWPFAGRAQTAGKLPIIGMLGSSPAAYSPWLAALLQRLREFGWIENRNMAIEYRWTEGNNERYPQIAAELVRLKVDVIVALGSPAIVAAKQATTVIPIVFPLASDRLATASWLHSPDRAAI